MDIVKSNMDNLAQYIDHTLLKAEADQKSLYTLCSEAVHFAFFSVCVNSSNVKFCKHTLSDLKYDAHSSNQTKNPQQSLPRIATTIGFPLGAMSTDAKCKELEIAKRDGADEFDFVINIGRVKSGDYDYVKNEIKVLKSIAGSLVIKAILETCLLTTQEIKTLSTIGVDAGADFIKTSTGFSSEGASFEAVDIMVTETRGSNTQVKASGGIRTRTIAERYIAMGVTRLGTSSGLALVQAEHSHSDDAY